MMTRECLCDKMIVLCLRRVGGLEIWLCIDILYRRVGGVLYQTYGYVLIYLI